MGAVLGQWLTLAGLGLIVAFFYYAPQWIETKLVGLKSKKQISKKREERRQKLRDRMEDKLWLAKEKKKIEKELEKEDGN